MPEPAGRLHTHAYARKVLREGWRTLHVYENYPTCSIVRVAQAGGKPSAGVAPTATPAAGLSGLSVVVNVPGRYRSGSSGPTGVQLEGDDREFWFLDLPATTGVAANTLQATDVIVFEGRRWRCVEGTIHNDVLNGSSSGVFRLIDSA